MAIRKLKNSWWVDFRFDGVRYRKRSPENSRAGARAYEVTLRQRLARGEAVGRNDRTDQELTVETFAERWFREYVLPNNKYSEQRNKQSILTKHLLPYFGRLPVNKVATQHVETFKAEQLLKGLKNKTINNHLTVLRSCLDTAHDWGVRKEAPPKVRWLRCPPPRTDFLSRGECDRLLAYSQGIWYELVLTALRTGLRRGELRALRWEDINWDTRILSVTHSWCEVRKGLVSPKSNRARHIPLDAELSATLYRRRKTSGLVFPNGNNNVLDAHTMSQALRRACKEAGLRPIGWHVLRHTFASHLAMASAPLAAVQALLGHASVTTTMRYAHLMPSTLRTTVDLLNPGDLGQPVGNARYPVATSLGDRGDRSSQKGL